MEDTIINSQNCKRSSCIHYDDKKSRCEYYNEPSPLGLILTKDPCSMYTDKDYISDLDKNPKKWIEKVYTTHENITPQKTHYTYKCSVCGNENSILPTDRCYKCLFKMGSIVFLDGTIGEVRDCTKCKYNTENGCSYECKDPYTGRQLKEWKSINNNDINIPKKEENNIIHKESDNVEENKPSDTNSIEDYMTDLFTSTINI